VTVYLKCLCVCVCVFFIVTIAVFFFVFFNVYAVVLGRINVHTSLFVASDDPCHRKSLYWSLGAALMESGREKFDAFVKEYAAMPVNAVDDNKLATAGEIPGNDRFVSLSFHQHRPLA